MTEKQLAAFASAPSGSVFGNPTRRRADLSVVEGHQLAIAQKTLRMPDAMVAVMGGMTKVEARRIVALLGQTRAKRAQAENPDRRRVKPTDLPVKEVVTTCQTRTKRAPAENPKLLILNPGSTADRIAAVAEQRLGRKVTPAEKAKLVIAIREFKEFQGRDPRPEELVPINAPEGTPLFVSMIGKLEEIRYSINVPSERRGKWRHAAGDHGKSGRQTKPAYLAAIPGQKRLNYTIVEPEGAKTYFKPSHGIMG